MRVRAVVRQFCGRYLPCKERHGIMGVNKEVKARKRRLPKGGGIGCASWQTIEIQEENYAKADLCGG